MSRLIALAVFVTIATGLAEAYQTANHVVSRYKSNVDFIKAMMLKDQYWYRIIRHSVIMPFMSDRHINHFEAPPNRAGEVMVVNPFKKIVDLMTQKTMMNTEVELVMEAVKNALLCSILRHVSLQTLLLEQIIIKEEERVTNVTITKWVKSMAQLAVDKLTAVEKPAQIINKLHFHLMHLLTPNKTLKENDLKTINAELYDESAQVCHCPGETGLFRTFIEEFSQPITVEKLKNLESLNTYENVKDFANIHNLAGLEHPHGKLNISPDIKPNEFGDLDLGELKKAFVVNRVWMHHTLLNLGLKSLASQQWTNIFNLVFNINQNNL